MRRIKTAVDALLSPPYCEHCSSFLQTRDIFCASCYLLIRPIASAQLNLTGSRSQDTSVTVHAIARYTEPLKGLILAKAYSNHGASVQLARLIWRLTPLKQLDFDFLVPIPLHWTRKIRRGYNQAEVIAQELSKLSGKPVVAALRRLRRTSFQSKFSQKEREKNVHNAFGLTGQFDFFQDKTLVIVDDLLTTGATLKNAAKLFIPIKPRKILAVVGARV